MSHEFLASRELFIYTLQGLCDETTNWGKVYRSLKDKQFHFSRPESFGKRSNDSYVAACNALCKKHCEFGMTTQPMISIGLQHKDALYIIRKLAGQFEQHVTCQCLIFTEEEVEEGELVNDDVFKFIESLTSNEFLFDSCIYDAVRLYSVSNT